MLTAVTGINWGDEGKGRVIDLLAEQAIKAEITPVTPSLLVVINMY